MHSNSICTKKHGLAGSFLNRIDFSATIDVEGALARGRGSWEYAGAYLI